MNDGNFYVYGDQTVKVPAHLNFGKFVLDNLRTKNTEIALENAETRQKVTYKEFTQNAVNVADALIRLGVKRGDVVAVGSEKRMEFVPTVLGIVFTGACYTPYETNCGTAVLRHKINITKPKYFIISKLFWNAYSELLKTFECIETIITLDEPMESIDSMKTLVTKDINVEKFEPEQVQGQIDTAFILYSSGTTGMPKGVQLTHLNCILNSLPDDFSDDSLKCAYMYGDWYHNYFTFMMYKFLVMGRKIIYANELTKETFFKNVEAFNVDIAFLVPAFIYELTNTSGHIKYNLDSLKVIYSRSSPLHLKIVQKVQSMFPKLRHVLQGYGMTEAGELTSETWGNRGPKSGSVGKASPGITLKVVDVNTRKTLGPNQRGEICLRGPVLMHGYIDIDPSTYLDEDGFFKTGDLGYYDDDHYFYIIERLKDILLYVGHEVAPLELETILQLHPGVRESGVVGRMVPYMGEEPIAFVVKQNGTNVTEDELLQFVAAEVPQFMQLKAVYFIDKIPRNARGKIVRQRLKEMLK